MFKRCWLTNKAYLSAIAVTNISQSFYLQDGGKKSTGIDMEQNYVTVTVCIDKKNQTVTVSECCLIKLFRCILFENRGDSGPGAKNVPSSRFCCVSTEWRWLRDDKCMFICFATMPACDGQTGGRRIAAHSALCRIASCGNDDKRAYITPHGSSAARLHSSVARSNSD